MAREHARIKTGIWIDDDFLDLTPKAQHLYFVLVSQMSLKLCGVREWHPARISQLAHGWSVEDVEAAGAELSEGRYLVIDAGTEEVLVRSFIRNDGLLTSPNITKGMVRSYSDVSSRDLKGVIVYELNRLHGENPLLKGWEYCADLLGKRSVDPSEVPSYNPSIKGSTKGISKGSRNTIDTPYSLLPTPNSPTPDSPRKPRGPYTDEFERIYDLYPMKAAKGAAFKAFEKAKRQISLEDLTDAVVRYRDDPNRDPGFTKHFSTWLNQGCWDDEPLPPRNQDVSASDRRFQQNLQLVQDLQGPSVFELGGGHGTA